MDSDNSIGVPTRVNHHARGHKALHGGVPNSDITLRPATMPPMPAAPPGIQGMRPPTPKDTRAPWLRLMDYRVSIADWDPARMARCEEACYLLDKAPVRQRAHAPLKDEKAKAEEEKAKKAGPPPEPMSETQRRKAQCEGRGPSCLRYEVRQTGHVPKTTLGHHQRRCADAPSTTASGTAQPKGGLYAARRAPTTASHRAKRTSSHPPHTNRARAGDTALDIDEEPSGTARPTVRALATRLFTAPRSDRSHAVQAPPKISAPMPLKYGHPGLKRKRGRADEADAAAPPTKRRAKNSTKYARSAPGSHSAESGTPVGRHVQRTNNLLPPPDSRAPSRAPGETKTSKGLPRWAVTAWAATVHALAAAVTAKLPATKNRTLESGLTATGRTGHLRLYVDR